MALLVLDASVVAKWFKQEVYTEIAAKIKDDYVEGIHEIILPDLIIEQMKPAAIGLHLGFNFLKPKTGEVIDPLAHIPEEFYQKISLGENENYTLQPNEFILAETLEKIGISKHLGFLLEGTSTMARLGITVVQTAMILDTGAGFPSPRRITLEIKNNGPNAVMFHPKMRVAKAVVFRLSSPSSYAYDDKRKYSGQDGVGAPKSTRKSD